MLRTLSIILRNGLILSILMLWGSKPGQANLKLKYITAERKAQQSESADANGAAEKAYNDGDRLYREGTAESLQAALAKFLEALQLYQSTGNRAGVAYTLFYIGQVYDNLGEYQKALDYYNQSLPLAQASGDRAGVAATLSNIGVLYDKLGDTQKAFDCFNQSLAIYRAVGDRAGEATTLANMGTTYASLGEKQKALDYYNQSLPLYQATDNRAGVAAILSSIGAVYIELGEYQKALDYYNQSLPRSQTEGDRSVEAISLSSIGAVYIELGEYQKALDYLNQSLAIAQAIGNRALEARAFNNIGGVYKQLGENQKALDSYNQCLQLSRSAGNRTIEAYALNSIGQIYDTLGEKQKALDYYNQSLLVSQAVGARLLEGVIFYRIGSVYSSLGEKQKAFDYYNQSLPLSRAVGDRSQEAITLYNIANVERDRGNFKEALTHIEASLKITEDLRTKIDSSELRSSYFSTVQERYEFYIDLLMQLHKSSPLENYDALALQVSERARARSLLEILNEAKADIRAGADPQLLEQENTLARQLDFLEKQRVKLLIENPKNAQKDELEKQIEAIQEQYQNLQTQIRTKSPRYAALTRPQPLNLQEIQEQVLDEDTLLLEYSLGEKRSYLWAVTKTGISSYELPPRADVQKVAKDFQLTLTVPSKRKFPQLVAKAADALSQIILKPVAAGQLGKKRLLIVADGALQYIPFSALTVPGKPDVPLILNSEIIALPSASTLAILRRDTAGRAKAPKALAVLADPIFGSNDERLKGNSTVASNSGALPIEAQQLQRAAADAGVEWNRLPFTQVEANQILALVPDAEKKQALGFAADRNAATNPELSQYRIIHFATHGFANSEKPELSGLVLSLLDEKGMPQNGYLRLRDIYNLNLPAELIVLSACQSGLGKNIEGEGLVGLTRGFMYAGAPRVVVSLWSVNDKATSELMVRFYQKMFKDNLAPAAALRAAQIEMLQQTEWKSPYFWAAFGLQGEWK